ncbi:hypothetical protein LM602_03450 [Candidatus Acetothermia bacterium]|jgi:uncharacterized membrane protein|nr:hypothetical protein [Candidatus Acetothermia bacterium]MCI2431596.1 hypothetical protein [Candidatus Acetothermia bacterium]MCI2436668.1 hypothetical protein [Candidatus Acetothermia bacterium]
MWNSQYTAQPTAQSWLDQALTFLYTAAHWLGQAIVGVVNGLIPNLISAELIDPIGSLALLTIIVVLVGVFEALRRLAYWVVGLGWLLLVLRIVLDKIAAKSL